MTTIRTIIGTKRNSLGDLIMIYYASDGLVYIDSASEGDHSSLQVGSTNMGQLVESNDLTFFYEGES